MKEGPDLFAKGTEMMAVEGIKIEHVEKILQQNIDQLAGSKTNRQC
jgi:hypothetical protein